MPEVVDASVGPRGSLENLSQSEIQILLNSEQDGIHQLFRKCALAVLNSGSDSDNAKEILDRYRHFDVEVVRHPWGIRLKISNAPATAFVDGQMIRGIKEHLFAVLPLAPSSPAVAPPSSPLPPPSPTASARMAIDPLAP